MAVTPVALLALLAGADGCAAGVAGCAAGAAASGGLSVRDDAVTVVAAGALGAAAAAGAGAAPGNLAAARTAEAADSDACMFVSFTYAFMVLHEPTFFHWFLALLLRSAVRSVATTVVTDNPCCSVDMAGGTSKYVVHVNVLHQPATAEGNLPRQLLIRLLCRLHTTNFASKQSLTHHYTITAQGYSLVPWSYHVCTQCRA